jgi:hypothetical protein
MLHQWHINLWYCCAGVRGCVASCGCSGADGVSILIWPKNHRAILEEKGVEARFENMQVLSDYRRVLLLFIMQAEKGKIKRIKAQSWGFKTSSEVLVQNR